MVSGKQGLVPLGLYPAVEFKGGQDEYPKPNCQVKITNHIWETKETHGNIFTGRKTESIPHNRHVDNVWRKGWLMAVKKSDSRMMQHDNYERNTGRVSAPVVGKPRGDFRRVLQGEISAHGPVILSLSKKDGGGDHSNHAVVLHGWKTKNDQFFWIARNSWGKGMKQNWIGRFLTDGLDEKGNFEIEEKDFKSTDPHKEYRVDSYTRIVPDVDDWLGKVTLDVKCSGPKCSINAQIPPHPGLPVKMWVELVKPGQGPKTSDEGDLVLPSVQGGHGKNGDRVQATASNGLIGDIQVPKARANSGDILTFQLFAYSPGEDPADPEVEPYSKHSIATREMFLTQDVFVKDIYTDADKACNNAIPNSQFCKNGEDRECVAALGRAVDRTTFTGKKKSSGFWGGMLGEWKNREFVLETFHAEDGACLRVRGGEHHESEVRTGKCIRLCGTDLPTAVNTGRCAGKWTIDLPFRVCDCTVTPFTLHSCFCLFVYDTVQVLTL
jgi:hypothetical protein